MLFDFFKHKGILGMNARNLLYLGAYNKKKAIKLADDKLKTKQFLSVRNIPVPRLYQTIKNQTELLRLDFESLPQSFVIKPNNGYGGEGIIPVKQKRNGHFRVPGETFLTEEEIKDHIKDILSGRFSLGNINDTAFFEQFIVSDQRLGKYSYEGLPDIRIVVHNLIPVMAMLRLPTKESKGKANLHQGAVGVGIDIGKGETTHLAYKGKIISELPDGIGKLEGLKIPFWDDLLLIASRIQLITNLGYMAVDLVIDKTLGPILLEINARAGLGLQIANLAPLRKRLERIQGINVNTPEKGVRIAKDMFGNVIERGVKNLSGKEIITVNEKIQIIENQQIHKVQASVDTSREISVFDRETAKNLGIISNENQNEKVKLNLKIKSRRIQTVLALQNLPNEKNPIILGRRDLNGFLIDPKIFEESTKIKKIQQNEQNYQFYRSIDRKLYEIDTKSPLLYHLLPTNLKEEREKFFKSATYNPQFQYPNLLFNPIEIVNQLSKINLSGEESFENILRKKKEELAIKIELLENINEKRFTELSEKLYGEVNEEIYQEALKIFLDKKKANKPKRKKELKFLSATEVNFTFLKSLKQYNLEDWKVVIKKNMLSRCSVGKKTTIFLNEKAKFTEKDLQKLIVHEIETHVLTTQNGKNQEFAILGRGTAGYLETQEGLAIYNTEKICGWEFSKSKPLVGSIIATYQAKKSSFRATYDFLLKLGFSENKAFQITLKVKRGLEDTAQPGAFTKSLIYFTGYKKVKDFLAKGGNIKDLYIGKISLDDIKPLKESGLLKKPLILPHWLSTEQITKSTSRPRN